MKTLVHVLRHGEVENPDGILYGRQADWHLSVRGREMAEAVAKWTNGRDIAAVIASPLERAQETAQQRISIDYARDKHLSQRLLQLLKIGRAHV